MPVALGLLARATSPLIRKPRRADGEAHEPSSGLPQNGYHQYLQYPDIA
jgi:hypothetical protein